MIFLDNLTFIGYGKVRSSNDKTASEKYFVLDRIVTL